LLFRFRHLCRQEDMKGCTKKCSIFLCLIGNRWANLWPPQGFAKSFTPTSGEPLQDDDTERDVSPSLASSISSFVFMGNFVMFASLLTGIFLFHVALASGVEAYWITKVRMA